MGERTSLDTERSEPEGREETPRWVKVFVVAGVAFLILLVLLLATGGHGPGRHSLPPVAAGPAHAQR